MTRQLDARVRRSQGALLKAGLELLNANPEATLSDIAAHAGVGRATLYRQYETRDKLVLAIAVDCLEAIDKAAAPIENEATSAMDAVRLLFERVMPLTQEFQFLMSLDQIAEDNAEIAAINAKQKREMVEMVEYGRQDGTIAKELPASWVINLIEGLFYAGWLQQANEGYTAREVSELAFSTFNRGVSSRRGGG